MWKVYFNLTKVSQLEVNSEINGAKVGISQASKELIVEDIDARDEADARQKALPIANKFLDALWKYDTYLGIDPGSQHTEYTSPTGQKHIYLTATESIGLSNHITVLKKDSSGNIIEVRDSSRPGRIEVKPSEAASYYRRAQQSNDPLDKFRELYLAAENVASKIQIAKGLSKNKVKQLSESGDSYEEGLLKLALEACFGSNQQPLKQNAKNLPEFDESQDTIPQLAKILYQGCRCQLDHSKASENKKIPFNPEDEREVKAALPLMEFVSRSFLQYEENSLLK